MFFFNDPKMMSVRFVLIFLLFSVGSVLSAEVVRVEDFGGVADGKTDCTAAFEKAIALAKEQGPGVTIQLGKGRYILSTELPEDVREVADTIFNLSACGNGFIVRNNILGGYRGRGVLARAHHGLIENNRIIDSPGSSIILQGVSGAVVRDNLVQMTANDRPIKEYYGIKLQNCEDIIVDGFTMSDQWSRIMCAVSLEGTLSEKVSISNVRADLGAKGQLIKQQH